MKAFKPELPLLKQVVQLSFLLSCFADSLYAGHFKFRAREHYEIHDVTVSQKEARFRGFSNTINAWYEEPFLYAVGLAAGPLLGSAKADGEEFSEFDEKIKLISIGLEGKYFPTKALGGTFLRLGLGWSRLQSDGSLKKSDGHHTYGGLGYELKVMKAGVALEFAYRQAELQNDVAVLSFTPSIGLHFYNL